MGAGNLNNQLDWPAWLASINLLQVAIVIVAAYVVIRLLVKFWPWLKKVMALTDALAQLPMFMAQTTKTLQNQNEQIAEIHHEVNYNNGSSVKDAVSRVELGVKGLYDRVDELSDSDIAIRKEIETTRPDLKLPRPNKE